MSGSAEMYTAIQNVLSLCQSSVWTCGNLDEIDRMLLSALAAVRQIRNEQSTLAISQRHTSLRSTPNEILSLIFEYFVWDPEDDNIPNHSDMRSIHLVCRRWRRVALGTPGLWRDILIDFMPASMIRKSIDCRRSLPFFVWATSLDSVSSASTLRPSFSGQVERLYLHDLPVESNLAWLHPSNLPNLQHLYITTSLASMYLPEYTYSASPTLTLSGFSKLIVVKLTGVMPDWAAAPFPASTKDLSLDLRGLRGSPSVTDLYDSLACLSRIRHIAFSTDMILAGTILARLRLPSIELMEITAPHEFHKEFVAILPPQHAHPYSLCLHIPPGQYWSPSPIQFYDNLRPVLQNRTNPYITAHLLLRGTNISIVLYDERFHHLDLTTRYRGGPRLDRVLDLIGALDVQTLTLEEGPFPSSQRDRAGLQDILPFFNNVTKLTIRKNVSLESSSILLGLAGAAGRFMFPDMEAYAVDWPCLETIVFQDVVDNFFNGPSDSARRCLGQCLWAISAASLRFRNVSLVRCVIDQAELLRWRSIIPSVECQWCDDDGRDRASSAASRLYAVVD